MKAYSDAVREPLLTERDVLRRVDALVGRALRRQLWLLFLDVDAVQLPTLVPIDGLPRLPDGVEGMAPAVIGMVQMLKAASVVIVYERPGDSELGRDDLEWADALRALCERAAVPLRDVVLSHDGGARVIPAQAPTAS